MPEVCHLWGRGAEGLVSVPHLLVPIPAKAPHSHLVSNSWFTQTTAQSPYITWDLSQGCMCFSWECKIMGFSHISPGHMEIFIWLLCLITLIQPCLLSWPSATWTRELVFLPLVRQSASPRCPRSPETHTGFSLMTPYNWVPVQHFRTSALLLVFQFVLSYGIFIWSGRDKIRSD